MDIFLKQIAFLQMKVTNNSKIFQITHACYRYK